MRKKRTAMMSRRCAECPFWTTYATVKKWYPTYTPRAVTHEVCGIDPKPVERNGGLPCCARYLAMREAEAEA